MAGQYDILRAFLSDRPIAFHPSLARAMGGVYEALLFQQLAYWSDKGDDPDWIYKTREDLRDETTMNRYQQEQARATLRKLGVIEEERRGLPARMYYRVVWPRVFELLEVARLDQSVGRRSTNKKAEIDQVVGEALSLLSAEDEPTSKSTSENTYKEDDSKIRKTPIDFEKYDDTRLTLLPIVEDFARELNDQAPLASTVTRVVNIYQQSGLDLDDFVERMYQARAITQERTASIRGRSEGFGAKPKAAYWLSVLADLSSRESA